MDALLKLKAFVTTAEKGTFSEAARAAGVSPSVIMKRIDELEYEFGVALFSRSTRHIGLTDIGQLYLPKIQRLIREYEELRVGDFRSAGVLEGTLRIKALTIPTLNILGNVFSDFHANNPKVAINVVTSDFPGNPVEEGFDLSIGIDDASYEGVFEELLCPYPRVVCASPDYLERKGSPKHPQDLSDHQCIAFSPAGTVWPFQTPRGRLGIDVHPSFATTNAHYLSTIACAGKGVAMLSLLAAKPMLDSGQLVPVLTDFPVVERWLKIMVPEGRIHFARVQALLAVVKGAFKTPPWWEEGKTKAKARPAVPA